AQKNIIVFMLIILLDPSENSWPLPPRRITRQLHLISEPTNKQSINQSLNQIVRLKAYKVTLVSHNLFFLISTTTMIMILLTFGFRLNTDTWSGCCCCFHGNRRCGS